MMAHLNIQEFILVGAEFFIKLAFPLMQMVDIPQRPMLFFVFLNFFGCSLQLLLKSDLHQYSSLPNRKQNSNLGFLQTVLNLRQSTRQLSMLLHLPLQFLDDR